MIREAIDKKIIQESERFSLHTLKRKGVTYTKGNRKEKQDAGGHRSESMLDIYDFDMQIVPAAADDK